MNSVDQHTAPRRGHPVAGTLVGVLLVAAWLLASGALGGASPARSESAGGAPTGTAVPVASTSYVVQPGDTLWSVARTLRPNGDLRPLVDHLGRHTGGRPLQVGQRIALP